MSIRLRCLVVGIIWGSCMQVWSQERSPEQVAKELAGVYGHRLAQVAYIPSVPLIAKLRLPFAKDEGYVSQVEETVQPFRRQSLPLPKSGSEQAGYLVFVEMAERTTGKEREEWIALVMHGASGFFDEEGRSRGLMPHHNEMSDSIFMACPLLAAAGKLSGETRYLDATVEHFQGMAKHCWREDGIYRHSPLCEAAWGRGNGFPAMGLAWALSIMPEDTSNHEVLRQAYRKHMQALRRWQDIKTGCWHQVIDHAESYEEYTCTCMIGWAMARGIRRGWISADEFQPHVVMAWKAMESRTSTSGEFRNVCPSTGKLKTLQEYLDRTPTQGKDDRGGAMGLLFVSELLQNSELLQALSSLPK
ncbi:MAG: glycoside hydrolase family 88 protein [Pirellulales bacterium]